MGKSMTRDQKIGLALGILLVGAVAAFFYRHETPAVAPLPELKSAAELDQQISEKPMAPYVEPRAPRAEASNSAVHRDPFTDQEGGGLVPEPIAMEPAAENAPVAKLASSTAVKPLTPPQASAMSETRHLVQRGDTLSSIAAKYLGSSARFEEIYEANRDRLRDANDLRIGQELKIPSRGLSVASPSDEAPGGVTLPGGGAEAAVPTSKFVPHPGPRSVPRTTAPTASSGGKRLSQVPPDDQIIRR